MRVKLKVWFAVIFLITTAAYGDESIAPFAKKFLNFDLTILPMQRLEFATTFIGQKVVGLTEPPVSQFLSLKDEKQILWVTNRVSAKYVSDFPNRRLVFGFRNGSVAVIRISVSALSLEEKEMKRLRTELVQIQNDLHKISSGKLSNFNDDRWNVQYSAVCSTFDPLYSIFQFTPLEKEQ